MTGITTPSFKANSAGLRARALLGREAARPRPRSTPVSRSIVIGSRLS
jgi:hypothetical protein